MGDHGRPRATLQQKSHSRTGRQCAAVLALVRAQARRVAPSAPGWYGSGPRQTEKPDFPSIGPHFLSRANITWRQEVDGSSIETSKIAGHANTKITEEYTIVQLKRQEELTRRIQGRRRGRRRRSGRMADWETSPNSLCIGSTIFISATSEKGACAWPSSSPRFIRRGG